MTFSDLGLAPKLLSALERSGLSEPTPIQQRAIPFALEERDVLGLAQTGTGKTLAFGLPLAHHLLDHSGKPEPRTAKALVLAPTRELAGQIADSLRNLLQKSKLRIVSVVGGQSIGRQTGQMKGGTDILVATPGRLMDLMERGAVDLSATRRLVLDEADQMLDLGFIHALRRIAKALSEERQTMLFSATMAREMNEVAATFLRDPARVEVTPPGRAVAKIAQSVRFMDKGAKGEALRDLLRRDLSARTLVFARTKRGAERLMKGLVEDGFEAVSIHGNKTQGQRDRAIKVFRSGRATVLVATDVAARGIDIPDVACVVNYELPEAPQNYVHRIGRTARAGAEGEAIAFCAPDEMTLLRDVEKTMGQQIPSDEERPDWRPAKKGGAARGSKRKAGRPKGGRPEGGRSEAGRPKGERSKDAVRSKARTGAAPKRDAGGETAERPTGRRTGRPGKRDASAKRPEGSDKRPETSAKRPEGSAKRSATSAKRSAPSAKRSEGSGKPRRPKRKRAA